MPAGRPSKYKPEFCEMLIEHISQGFSFESFAAHCNVSEDTLYEWLHVHPEFSDSKKIAHPKGRLFWEKMAKEGLWGSKEAQFNSTVWIFSMKNRFGWRDKIDLVPEKKDLRDLDTNQKKLMLQRAQSAIEALKKDIDDEELKEKEAVKV